jgi:hypothetical protein
VNLFRATVFGSAALLLGGGYLASQWAFLNGTTEQYAKAIDTPQVAVMALALLLACVVLACLRQEEGAE